MIDTLVAFGCSFTYGDELLDPKIKPGEPCNSRYNDHYRNKNCFAGRVADHYNLNFINTAEPGGTLESMRYALYWATQNLNIKNCLLIVGMTEPSRNSYFDDNLSNIEWTKHRHSTWLKTSPVDYWSELDRLWTSLCYCDNWEKFNVYQTLQIFESANVPMVFLPIFEAASQWDHKYKADFVLQSWLADKDFAEYGHPNQNGHQKVAQRLIKYIDRVKLIG